MPGAEDDGAGDGLGDGQGSAPGGFVHRSSAPTAVLVACRDNGVKGTGAGLNTATVPRADRALPFEARTAKRTSVSGRANRLMRTSPGATSSRKIESALRPKSPLGGA